MTPAPVKPAPLAHITVSAFDVHCWSKRFDAAQFNPDVHFLWSPAAYREKRKAGRMELKNLFLFPLKQELEQKRNRFWCRYDTSIDNLSRDSAGARSDDYEFLWPLRCRPRNFKLSFTTATAGVSPTVWSTIWLWPFGWSSVVEFKVASPRGLDDLEDLGIRLRGAAPKPFILGTGQLSLSEVFQRLGALVKGDLAAAGNAPDDVTRLSRHAVMSLQWPRGMPLSGNVLGGSAANQLRMLAALRGRKVQPGELTQALITPLGERNFAMTDFDKGTLLLLRHWRDRSGAKPETNHCLFANLRTFSMIFFTLQGFIQYAKDRPDAAGAVASAKNLLAALPNEYRNALPLNFKKYYSSRDRS